MIQVPDGWGIKPLKDILSIQYGKDQKEIELVNGKYPILGSGGVIGYTNHFLYDKPSVLIGRKGTINNPQYMETPFWTVDTLFYSHIKNKNVPKWVYYVFQSINWDSYNEASGVPSLSTTNINRIEILRPTIKEQEKIAKILSTLDNAIESTNRIIEKERNIKTALMQKLLTNGIDQNGQIRTPQTHIYKPSELGLIPDEWEVDKINEVTKLMTDFVANGSFESLANNVTVFESSDFAYYVRLFDIRKGLGHEKQTYVNEQSFNFLKKSSLIGREILIANIGANVGETFLMPILKEPATIAPNMIVIKVNSKIIPEFLFYFLTFHKGISELQNVTEGSGQPKINKTKLKTINVIIPLIKEQEKIIKILNIQDKKIEIEETNLAKLKELKKGLMNDLLSGKVRVDF